MPPRTIRSGSLDIAHVHASLFGWTLLISLALVGSFFDILSTGGFISAADPSYQGMVVSVTAPKQITQGQTIEVVATIKNTGTKTWKSTGANFVSLYHWDPVRKVEATSLFSTPAWSSDTRATRLPVGSVTPGKSATFHFVLKAPPVSGAFHEPFILAAEGVAWLKYSQFTVDLTVKGSTGIAPVVANTTVASAMTPPATGPAPSMSGNTAGWSAQLVEKQGTEWQINMDDHVPLSLGFKNTGTKTWTKDGANYVSIYAVDGNNKERTSTFADSRWISPTHPAKLKEASVAPGETGHFIFDLRPQLPGGYQETFALSAEKTAWIPGGSVSLPIRVPLTAEFIATAPPSSDAITSVPDSQVYRAGSGNGNYLTTLTLRSATNLSLLGNGRQSLTFGFKNLGTATWNTLGLRIRGIQPALMGKLTTSVQDDSWVNSAQPLVSAASVTQPGQMGFVNFTIKAPAKRGAYTASFQLLADNQAVDGGIIDIPITVTADGYIDPNTLPPAIPTPATPSAPFTSPSAPSQPPMPAVPINGNASSLPSEPLIRVGLFATTDNQMVVRAKYAALTVSQNGTTVCHMNTGDSVTVTYDRTNRVYKISGGACAGQSSNYYAIRADDGVSPMELADFSRPVSWLPGANDNTFRAELELRYAPATDSVWVINELPIEWYLKGIGETSNSSPQEYQRALLTAARTYAMYHVQHATKHASENFIVDATYDQVYRGYGAEARDPNVVTAVDATRGQIVTYNGALAITPYYSRSDGRTRSWTEVWGGGPHPWLVSVPVPWDQGKTLWGHGVGMSATGALGAAADGWTYDRILKYFYQGITLMQVYK